MCRRARSRSISIWREIAKAVGDLLELRSNCPGLLQSTDAAAVHVLQAFLRIPEPCSKPALPVRQRFLLILKVSGEGKSFLELLAQVRALPAGFPKTLVRSSTFPLSCCLMGRKLASMGLQ